MEAQTTKIQSKVRVEVNRVSLDLDRFPASSLACEQVGWGPRLA